MTDQQLNKSISSADTLDTFTYRPLQHNDETRILQIVRDSDATGFKCRPVLKRLSARRPRIRRLVIHMGRRRRQIRRRSIQDRHRRQTAIECDDASFMITNNLHAALCVLRDQHDVTA